MKRACKIAQEAWQGLSAEGEGASQCLLQQGARDARVLGKSALTGAMEERDRMSINEGPVWAPMDCNMLHRSHVQAATRKL